MYTVSRCPKEEAERGRVLRSEIRIIAGMVRMRQEGLLQHAWSEVCNWAKLSTSRLLQNVYDHGQKRGQKSEAENRLKFECCTTIVNIRTLFPNLNRSSRLGGSKAHTVDRYGLLSIWVSILQYICFPSYDRLDEPTSFAQQQHSYCIWNISPFFITFRR